MPPKSFFKEDSPHGLVKRLMLKKYLQAYIEKTQNSGLDTIFIDGFAGEGRYSNEWPCQIEKYGSPLVALMVVLEFCYKKDLQMQKKYNEGKANIWGWPPSELDPENELEATHGRDSMRRKFVDGHARINLIFIESETKSYRVLAANVELLIIKFLTKHYPDYQYGFSQEKQRILHLERGCFSLKIKLVNDEFANFGAPPMLQNQKVRSLTFLDPYGFTQTPMSHIQQFVPGSGNEILINFMSSFVNRFVAKHPKKVGKLYGISVAEYFGIDPPDLRKEHSLADFIKSVVQFSQPEAEQICTNNINKCASNYEDFLRSKTECKYSLMFEFKNKRNTTLFHMVHVTNHIKGVEAMKESMNRCSQEEDKMMMSDYDIVCKGKKLDLRNMDDSDKVAEVIFNKFKGKNDIVLNTIKNYILLKTCHLFRKKPLQKLQKSKKIIEVKTTKGKRQERRYTFPDVDSRTKEPLTWLLSFADVDCKSE